MKKKKLFDLDLDGYTVKVFTVPKSELPGDGVGQFSGTNYEILVAGDWLKEESFPHAETMMHELIHAVSVTSLPTDEDLSENQVLRLGFGLTNLLKRNPHLRRYLWRLLR